MKFHSYISRHLSNLADWLYQGGYTTTPYFFGLSESIMRIHMNQVYTMKGWQSGITPRPCAARDDRGFWTLHRCIWHCKCTVYRMTVAVVWRCARAVYLATCTKNIWGCPKSYEVAQVLIQVVALGIDFFKKNCCYHTSEVLRTSAEAVFVEPLADPKWWGLGYDQLQHRHTMLVPMCKQTCKWHEA